MSTRDPQYQDLSVPAHAVVWAWLVIGVTFLVSTPLSEIWDPSSVMAGAPDLLRIITGGMIAFGSVASLAVNQRRLKIDPSNRWKWETIGTMGTMGGWFIYTVTSLTISPLETITWTLGISFTVASFSRWMHVRRVESVDRQSLRELKRKVQEK